DSTSVLEDPRTDAPRSTLAPNRHCPNVAVLPESDEDRRGPVAIAEPQDSCCSRSGHRRRGAELHLERRRRQSWLELERRRVRCLALPPPCDRDRTDAGDARTRLGRERCPGVHNLTTGGIRDRRRGG